MVRNEELRKLCVVFVARAVTFEVLSEIAVG